MLKTWFQKNYNKTSLEKKLLLHLNRSRTPNFKQLKYLNKFLNKQERIALASAVIIFVVSFVFLANNYLSHNLEVVASSGGKYIEGSLVPPSYINPLYSGSNTTDDSLSKLIYSSLWQRDQNGSLAKDLVEDYQVSEDQKVYTIKITKSAKWHSGEALSAEDILFTFNTIKDSRFKSPLRRFFVGVDCELIDSQTLTFTLKEPYAIFPELLTFGILPKHLWQDISPTNINLAQLNIRPVGSGPYKFQALTKDKNGNIKSYSLIVNKDYYRQAPYLHEIDYKFFASTEELFDALNNNRVDAINHLPNGVESLILTPNSFNFHQIKQAQLIGIYFNLDTNSILSDKALRQALAHAINKEELVRDLYQNKADLADSALPTISFGYSDQVKKYSYDPGLAQQILNKQSWKSSGDLSLSASTSSVDYLKKNGQTLELTITVINNDENLKLAEKISSYWSAIGVKVVINAVDQNIFYSQIIKPKKYSILIYNTLNNLNSEPYPFWDSSQSGDKGFNLSNYNNPKIDKLLETARINNNLNLRANNYLEFQKIIAEELPVIYLLSPQHTYLQNKKIKGFNTKVISTPEDIYYNINSWYTVEKKSFKF